MHTTSHLVRSLRMVPLALALVGTAACDGLFEVNNPNQLVQDNLDRPDAVTALVNGAQASLARGLAQVVLPVSVAGDELTSIGSLDYGRQLDQGALANPSNEITNSAFPLIAEARFMADEAIVRLTAFDEQGLLRNRAELARAYLYGGIVYTAIADAYDDFVISDRRAASPPIGRPQMVRLYDRAIEFLDEGLRVARAAGSRDLEVAILAHRARTRHARGVWLLLAPLGTAPIAALVADEVAVADAEAALRLVPSPDWRLQFRYGAATVGSSLGSQVNVRQEYRVGDRYAVPTADNKRVAAIRLQDPVSGRPDAALQAAVDAFVGGAEYPALTVVSARELHLIVAEAALARGDGATAAAQLDLLRALSGREAHGGAVALDDLLRHERRVNLFLQGRRLADHYRFREPSPTWLAASDAARTPGTLLPIAQIERLSNCHIVGTCR